MGLFGPIDSWARPGHRVAGVVASVALSVLCWPLLTVGAQSPTLEITGSNAPQKSAGPAARLVREGDKVVILGSVAMLFNTGSFTGPNRAEKVNRARLT